MQRRGFLGRRGFLDAGLGAVALGSTAAVVGCGGAPLGRELGQAEALALCARLRRGMQMLADEPFGALPAGAFARPDLTEHVLRLSIESLLVLDVVRAVPEDTEIPAVVRDALAPHLPRLDRSVHTHRALLARMPASERRALDARARVEPEIGMNVAEWIDGHAARIGVPADNRLRLRGSAVNVKTRLRRQSTTALIDDCTQRLDEVLARHALPLPAALDAHTNAVVDAMWRRPAPARATAKVDLATVEADRRAIGSDRTEFLVPSRFGAGSEMDEPTEPVQWNASWARPGDEERRLGSIMMPLGLVTCGVLLIAGLVVFISGLVQNSEWDGRTQADDAPRGYWPPRTED